MVLRSQQWWVPVGSFVVAAALSFVAGSPRTLLLARDPGSSTGNACQVSIKHLKGTLNASGWLNNDPLSPNKIEAKGSYDTTVNTPSQDLDERLQIFVKLTITFAPESGEDPFTGSAWGTLKHVSKPGLAGTNDPNNPKTTSIDFDLEGNGTDELDNALTEIVNQIAQSDPQGAGAVAKTDLITKLNAALSARVTVLVQGSLEGQKCQDSAEAGNTLSFDASGNALKEKNLEPGTAKK